MYDENRRFNDRPQQPRVVPVARPAVEVSQYKKIGNFYDAAGKVRADLFNEYAEDVAKSLSVSSPKGGNEGVSSTQLRRLFDEVKRYDRLLSENDSEKWDEQLPYIKMIKSKVRYTAARTKKNAKAKHETGTEKCYDNLISFISEGIDLIKTQKDYRVFSALFEAVYGFYYENKPDNN
ncbi:MAG: type III-A CRISPR-associated protein Csm2 [Bacteroides sp.]|nr:type III-A CRISPR-associated protein Csm2 [Prevotella sp.]MCM1406949.1 type III-A CRISPR-associated protein Csm2 [Treponema brennaborense]MCM1470100.1 type III-A CRISPR-associated protein Csm2 [Bacteroides sp.]